MFTASHYISCGSKKSPKLAVGGTKHEEYVDRSEIRVFTVCGDFVTADKIVAAVHAGMAFSWPRFA